MSILERTVDNAVAQKWIPASDRQAVINRINQIGNKYNVSPDDFAIITMMEAGGLNPSKPNGSGCYGIIQFCQGTGAATVGYSNASDIANLSVLEQLELTDKYFQAQGLKPGSDLEDLYLTVLYPAARDIKARDVDLGVAGQQSLELYDENGNLTRNSLRAGLERHASSILNEPVVGSAGFKGGSLNLPGSPSLTDQIGNIFNSLSTFLTSGQNCPPPEYTLGARLTYTGCVTKIKETKQGGIQGLGYPAPGMSGFGNKTNQGGYGTGNAGVNKPYLGPAAPGSYTVPAEGVLTSEYGERVHPISGTKKMHHGIDIAAPVGTPIHAAYDGIVTSVGFNEGGYGNKIEITHPDGNKTIYAHLDGFNVQEAMEVRQGQVIGTMGSTGYSTGPHLHFEVRDSAGNSVDPEIYIGNL